MLKLPFSLIVLFLSSPCIAQESFDVFVFSKTNGFRHESIEDGINALKKLGAENNFYTTFSEDSTDFNNENLDTIEVVVFLNNSGDLLNVEQKSEFKKFINNGGGYVGIHGASTCEREWPWYGELVGRYFQNHPHVQAADLIIADSNHPSTEELPVTWTRTDEWYNFLTPFPNNLTVLVSVDENSYSGGTMGEPHPISWYHEFDNGRSFYTAMGHTSESYEEPDFLNHILGGILWAAKSEPVVSSVNDTKSSKINIYPNPANSTINIEFSSKSRNLNISNLEVFNLNGKIIYADNNVFIPYQMNIESFVQGYYVLNVRAENDEEFQFKFIVD